MTSTGTTDRVAKLAPARIPIPRVSQEAFKATRAAMPVIIEGAARGWRAVGGWTPEFFKAAYTDVEVNCRMSLPADGVPYARAEKDHRQKLTISAFIDRMIGGERCYVDSDERHLFAALKDDYSFEELVDGEQYSSLWLGARTRSGMHYDVMANLLAQVYGTKKAIVMSPEFTRAASPFPDDITKSRVDPTAPDLATYPGFAGVVLWEGELAPGDILSIPRGWWHFLQSPDVSISINCWYGAPLTLSDHLNRIRQAGASVALRVGRDFVWHGALGRPYQQRLFCPPPVGKIFFDLCSAALRARRTS